MRRLATLLLATTAGTALLVGLKAHGSTAPSQPVAGAALDPGPQSAAAATGPSRGTGPSRSTSPSWSAKPGRSAKPGATAKPAPAKSKAPATTTAAPATKTAAPATRTIVGAAYPAELHGENYGNMQVKIVVTGSHIDQVVTVQQSSRPREVASVLGARAVSQQSADVGNVSGATASSDAYKKSLQSAIDQI
jgi:uncharacterized protein with FMN-binding domain